MVNDRWSMVMVHGRGQWSTIDHGPRIIDYRPWTMDWTMGHRPWAMDVRPWTMDHGPWAIDHGSSAMDFGPWTMGMDQSFVFISFIFRQGHLQLLRAFNPKTMHI